MSTDRDLRVLLREALAHAAANPVEAGAVVDPWCKGRLILLIAQPSDQDLGWFQEWTKPNARKLVRVEGELDRPYPDAVEYILDPWHEPSDQGSSMTSQELSEIRRLTPEPWAPRWKHRVNPKKGIDVEALLRQLI